ncbi:MAG: phosphorylase [Candidatus Binatia bacterium]|jgi:adenosylhomocysteine nucleosidase
MLGIVVSLPRELKSLTREAIPVGAWRALTDNTLVALSGIGPESAHRAGTTLVAQGARALVSWGCAAALDDRASPGWLILPERIIGAHGEIYKVNAEWHQRIYKKTLEADHPVIAAPLVESDKILKTSAEKKALATRTQAAATDMESAAQARLAQEHGLPFIAIRAIVDTVSTNIPENVLKALDSQGDVTVWKLITSIPLMPADWLKLIQLGIQFNAAQRTLKRTSKLVLDASWV